MYDGASALAEAILMAMRINPGKKDILMPETVHPEYRHVVATYLRAQDARLIELPFTDDFQTDWKAGTDAVSEDTCCLVVQSPNFFGVVEKVEEIRKISERVHEAGGVMIVTVAEPISLGVLVPPGEYGADIVVGEGQSLGNPVSFGGPFLGLFATKNAFVRKMPGRLVGQTADTRGERGYVLTLATREQHIRREKATSNICTNQSLCALRGSIYLSVLGKRGFRDVALMNMRMAHHAREKITSLPGFHACEAPVFNEFVVETPVPVSDIQQRLSAEGIVGGFDMSRFFPGLNHHILFCVTEMNRPREIERLCEILGGMA